tara:strand:- start:419 stop:766 length:348 start_codon:yes stop_codon:yes gene_type:complete
MSKVAKKEAKEKRKAEIEAARNKNPSMVELKCVFPPCNTPVMVKAPPEGITVGTPQHMATLGGIPMCAKHIDMLNFHVWATLNTKMEKQRTPGGLVLPGHEKYYATVNEVDRRKV